MGVSLPLVATVPTSALKLRTTTLFLVRHADIPPNGADPNPHLTTNGGQARATELVHSLGRVAIGAVYVSDAFRTQETAAPLAEHLGGLTPLVISAASAIVDHVKANFLGRTVFIAGHSNTVPEIITQFGGEHTQAIGPTEFDRLFILSVTELLKRDTQVGSVISLMPSVVYAILSALGAQFRSQRSWRVENIALRHRRRSISEPSSDRAFDRKTSSFGAGCRGTGSRGASC